MAKRTYDQLLQEYGISAPKKTAAQLEEAKIQARIAKSIEESKRRNLEMAERRKAGMPEITVDTDKKSGTMTAYVEESRPYTYQQSAKKPTAKQAVTKKKTVAAAGNPRKTITGQASVASLAAEIADKQARIDTLESPDSGAYTKHRAELERQQEERQKTGSSPLTYERGLGNTPTTTPAQSRPQPPKRLSLTIDSDYMPSDGGRAATNMLNANQRIGGAVTATGQAARERAKAFDLKTPPKTSKLSIPYSTEKKKDDKKKKEALERMRRQLGY